MMTPALLFDMDGVLIDSNPFHRRALEQFCRSKGLELSEEDLTRRVFGRTNADWIPDLFPGISRAEARIYADEKEALYREIYAAEIEPVEGLHAFLEQARDAGHPMIVGTSAPPENVTFVFGKLGLDGFFDRVVDETRVTSGKPDPQVYRLCAEELDTPPAQCIVFEDSLVGVTAGVAAGCAVVGISTTHTDRELTETGAATVVPSFKGLAPADLSSLLGA